jgi:putative ABC transport system permease protein
MMIKNYFKIALRNLIRHRGYSFINITGMAIGISCCLLILMFVNDELSYDSFNEKAHRIFRVALKIKYGGRAFRTATIGPPVGKALKADFPEVEEVVRFGRPGSFIVSVGENNFKEYRVIYCDPTLFKVFTLPLLLGDPATALKEPNTLVLTRKTAEKYFGRENPLGKTLKLDNKRDFKVTGVLEEIPRNCHFNFDIFLSIDSLKESREPHWLMTSFNTYLLLGDHVNPETLETKLPEVVKKYMAPMVEKFSGQSFESLVASGNINLEFFLQPLRRIHLFSDLRSELGVNSDIAYVYIFSAIAFFILLIAAVNFMNLSTARSANRAREVGIRKVLGSMRSQLIRQFLTESIIISIISVLIALVLVNLALPLFNTLTLKELALADFFDVLMVAATIMITLITGLLAGLYPAFFISAFRPISVLKGQLKAGSKNGWLRSTLVVFQFTTSIILIIGTLMVMHQLDYIRNRKLGFNKEHLLILRNANLLDHQVETFKKELLAYPQIKNATMSSFLPGPASRNSSAVFPEGQVSNKKSTALQNWWVDYGYIDTLGMTIIDGRNFSREFSTDDETVIINQQTAYQFGWEKPLGKRLSRYINKEMKNYTVIGVVEDFHFDSLRDHIGPLAMFLGQGRGSSLITFRIDARNIPGTIDLIRQKWQAFLLGQPFEYYFLGEVFDRQYRDEQRLGQIFGTFAVLSIFVGCLGLFGLAAFISQQRTKEIGIRKTLGASVSSIIRLLSKEFLILVVIANATAWPIAYLVMNRWLQDFAYRASLKLTTFIIAGIGSIIIALLTTGYQAIKAAVSDPIEAIKYE